MDTTKIFKQLSLVQLECHYLHTLLTLHQMSKEQKFNEYRLNDRIRYTIASLVEAAEKINEETPPFD